MIDREQAIEALNDRLTSSKRDAKIWPADDEWNKGWLARRRGVEDALAIIAALPAIPLDADTELSDIMEYLCEHFDASMDEHEVSRMSAMIREYASNVAKSRGALPVLETKKETT